MWLLVFLALALVAVAFIENFFARARLQREFMEKMRHSDMLMALALMTDMCEGLYVVSSTRVEYTHDARRRITELISLTRQLLSLQQGAPETVRIERSKNSWPFDSDGKVKL